MKAATHPTELTIKHVMPKLSEQLNALGEQQAALHLLIQQSQQSAVAVAELQRRRDEAMLYELQRHSEAMVRIQTGAANISSSTTALDLAIASTTPICSTSSSPPQSLPAAPLPLPSLQSTAGTSTLFSTSPASITSLAHAREVPHTSAAAMPSSLSALGAYSLSPLVKTVADAWQEWSVGFKGGPSLQSLEQEHGTKWCGGPSTPSRKAFLRRMVIIKAIRDGGDGTEEQRIAALQQKMGAHSLDWLRKQLS